MDDTLGSSLLYGIVWPLTCPTQPRATEPYEDEEYPSNLGERSNYNPLISVSVGVSTLGAQNYSVVFRAGFSGGLGAVVL